MERDEIIEKLVSLHDEWITLGSRFTEGTKGAEQQYINEVNDLLRLL